MKMEARKRRLANRVADYNSMKATGETSTGKWVVVSGSKTQFYRRPGSLKKK